MTQLPHNQFSQKLSLPAAMAEKLESVRRRTLRVRIGTAIVAALGVLLAAMAVAMLVDWLATIYDFRWRALLTYSAWTTAAATLLAWAIAAWRHTRRVDKIAAKVDHEIPELEERWSTVANLSTNGQAKNTHPAMWKQVTAEAQSWTPRIETDRVVPLDGLIRALLFLTAITTVLGLAVLLDNQRTGVLLKRFWQPYTAISATELIDVTDQKIIGRGESIDIEASLIGTPVKQATLLLEPQAGDAKTITLVPRGDDHDRLSHRLRGVKEPLRYRLRAGDGQTPWYEIAVADRPQLAYAQLTLTPPAYTRKEPQVIRKLPRRVTVLEGSRVEIAFKPKQELKTLELQLGDGYLERLTADEAGWYHWETTLTKNLSFQPLLTEEHGLSNLRPPTCEIKCRPDKPPVVKILTPNNQMAVRPDESVPVTFVASDDVGVYQAEMLVYDEGQKVDGQPVVLDRIPVPLGDQQGALNVKATVDLDLSKYKTTDGSELSFSIRVREDRGQEMLASNSINRANNNVATPQTPAEAAPTEATSADSQDTAAVAPAAASTAKMESPATTGNPTENPSGENPTADHNSSAPQSASSQTNARQLASQSATDEQGAKASSSAPMKQATTDTAKSETTPTDEKSAEGIRTSASERQTLNTDEATAPQPTESEATAAAGAKNDVADNDAAAGKPQQEMTEGDNRQAAASSAASTPTAGAQNSSPSNPPNSPDKQTSPPQQPQDDSPSPGNPLNRRGLDVPSAQSSNSQRMKLKIDEWAGSYDEQQRRKLEVAIAPRLEAMGRALEKAQALSRAVLDAADVGQSWASKHDRDLQLADKQIETAIAVVETLEKETYGTPYAFIGLQLVDINQAHVGPARRDFWKAMQTSDTARIDALRDGWQHVTRARELLALLTQRYERTKAEYALADSVEKIKKVYRIFVEDSMAMLTPNDNQGSRYNRKRVEFDLDEEYLKRLEEVLKMRNEMRAELARILADDPRLLRRFLDAQRNRGKILRNELDRIIERQSELNRETRAWEAAAADKRPQLAAILLGRHIESSQDLAIAAAELQDRFETWSPLGKEVEDAQFQQTAKVLQEIATATSELSADGADYVSKQTKALKTEDAPEAAALEAETAEKIATSAQQLYDRFTQLEVHLRQIGNRQERPEISFFATNRLLETRRLIEQTSAWIRQLQQQRAGNYHRSAEVAQYRLAMETDAMAGKLADLEQTMTGLLQRDDGQLPQSIAEKARGLLVALDEQAAPNQLAAVYALRRNRLPQATSHQESAEEGLKLAGKLYDEMIEASIIELDKLPVQDPIAGLLEDPTLDELLRELEQEIPIQEALGIPQRSSNLQIMSDWLRSGGDNALSMAGNRQMMLHQLRLQQQLRQRRLDRAYRKAVARALQETEAEDLIKDQPKLARETANWNRLASQLEEEIRQGADKAPPERYRRAIEQYFRQVSGAEGESK